MIAHVRILWLALALSLAACRRDGDHRIDGVHGFVAKSTTARVFDGGLSFAATEVPMKCGDVLRLPRADVGAGLFAQIYESESHSGKTLFAERVNSSRDASTLFVLNAASFDPARPGPPFVATGGEFVILSVDEKEARARFSVALSDGTHLSGEFNAELCR